MTEEVKNQVEVESTDEDINDIVEEDSRRGNCRRR